MTEGNSAQRVLSPQEIFQIKDLQTITVDMTKHGWPGSVMLQELPSNRSEEFASDFSGWDQNADPKRIIGQRARLVAMCLVNPETKVRVASTEEDIKQVAESMGQKGTNALNELFNACLELNKFLAKAVEEEARDFPATPAGDSPTASRSN